MTFSPETSRIAKVLVDAGACGLSEADRRLAAFSLEVHLSPSDASTLAGQAAALTAIVTASRCFLGGVMLTGATDEPLLLPLPIKARTLGAAAVELGCLAVSQPSCAVVIGGSAPFTGWAVRAWWDGWVAGVCPADDDRPPGRGNNCLAGVAAGALAVAHAFRHVQGDVKAGRTAETVSLWEPDLADDPGPRLVYLPKALWFVGLGNLGQAYLWSLSMLPYTQPQQVELFFQDFDIVKDVNWGTSILVRRQQYGMLKNRAAEDWALGRGFGVKRIDRRFDHTTARQDGDPAVALSGLDSLGARRLLGVAGFDFVIDCGLGATALDYRKFRLTVFDPPYGPEDHFHAIEDDADARNVRNLRLPAYQDELARDPQAGCGMAELAGASAAVPFVSAFASALVITQAIRISSDQPPLRTMVGTVDEIQGLRVVPGPTVRPGQVGYAEPMHC